MRIKDDCFNTEDRERICLELTDLLDTPSDKQARPCPGCRFTFEDDASISSTRHCSAQCPYVAQQMSSDPETYPVEEGVVPIVYAFYTMRLMMPCWSCEGHFDKHGVLAKLPSVWFYSTSHFFPKLLAQYLGEQKGRKSLRYHWGIRILPFSQSMFTTTYALEPIQGDLMEAEVFDLDRLQADMDSIAKNMRRDLMRDARHYLQRAKRSPLKKARL